MTAVAAAARRTMAGAAVLAVLMLAAGICGVEAGHGWNGLSEDVFLRVLAPRDVAYLYRALQSVNFAPRFVCCVGSMAVKGECEWR
jgi:hypothetical protein